MTMTSVVTLCDPTAPPNDMQSDAARPTLENLAGKVVGFIDNSKPNFCNLVDDLSELLMSKYGAKRVVKRKKTAASIPATQALIDELALECDLVIAGSGD